MRTIEPILAEHPFFKELETRYLQLIVGCATNVRFDAGQFIFREDEEANHFYLIRHGKVALEIFSTAHDPIVIETLGEGEVMGWAWLVPPYRTFFDARAVELTRAIALDGKCLRGKCAQDHGLCYELMNLFTQIIVERLQATRLQLLDVYGVHSGSRK